MNSTLSLQLDTPTLVIALCLVYAGSFSFSLGLYLTKRGFPGAISWVLGQFFLLLGALSSGGEVLGLPYSVLAIANTALVASLLLMDNAVRAFRKLKAIHPWLYLLLPMSLAFWFFPLGDGLSFRVLWFSGILSIVSGHTTWLLVRAPEPEYRLAYRSAAVFFGLMSLSGISRVIQVLAGAMPDSLAEQGRMGASVYAMAIVAAFFLMFGYFLLISVRSEARLKENELAIRRRNDSLNRLVAMKDALITVVGHDLRVPIASAARYTRSHLLEYEGSLEDKRESVEVLAEGLDRAAALLSNLVDWARSASGRMEFRLEEADLSAIAREAARDLATAAERKNVHIGQAEGRWTAMADPRAASTVIRNLLSNAIKYSYPGGSIAVSFSSDGPERIVLAVTDQGVGMSEEQAKRLFEPGKTIQTLGTDGEQGTGLGLSLCKAFMEAQSGQLRVHSQTGKGSCIEALFLLSAPANPGSLSQAEDIQ